MINDGDGKEIKRDYLDILEALLQRIQHQAKSKEIPTNNDINIFAGGRQVYKGVVGQSPSKNTLTPSQIENINKAVTDPKTSQGTISIKIGKDEVFRVQNGIVSNDKLGLAPPIQQNKVVTKERTYSVEALQKQVQVLQNKLGEQQKLVDSIKQNQQTPESLSQLAAQVAEMAKSLEKQQQLIENTQKALLQVNERSLPQIQNTQLQNWVGKIEHQVKQTSKNLFERIKDVLTPEVTKLRNEVSELKSQLHQQITSFKDEVRNRAENNQSQLNQQLNNLKSELHTKTDNILNTVETKVGEVRQNVDSKIKGVQSSLKNTKSEFNQAVEGVKSHAIEQSVKAFIKLFGKENPDGSRSFKSASFDFEQQGDNVIVRTKKGEVVLEDGVLSPNVNKQQLQALNKVQSAVDMHHKIENNAQQESQSRGMHR